MQNKISREDLKLGSIRRRGNLAPWVNKIRSKERVIRRALGHWIHQKARVTVHNFECAHFGEKW